MIRNKAAREAMARLLRNARYEVLPVASTEEKVLTHLPKDRTVTVTASPGKGLDATFALAESLTRQGYDAVPHIAARMVSGRGELKEICDRLTESGISTVFVPGGDAEPVGDYPDALSLLEDLTVLGKPFANVGITGYPESHHLISDEETIRAMFAKAPMATCIISQICFDAGTIASWIAEVRRRGTALPIWVGLPGTVDYAKLVRISMKIGLGESARFLRHHSNWMARLMTRQFRPDPLIAGLGATLADPAMAVAGFHLYTFNEVEKTERWRRRTLERLSAQAGIT